MDKEKNIEIILAQWQTCVEMANSISQRRDTMNNIFVTLNLAVIGAASIVWDLKSIVLLIAGIVMSALWIKFIHNYKILNSEKYKVIQSLEKSLPFQPYKKEWDEIKKSGKYKDSTSLEKILPISFIILYGISIVLLIILHFINGGIS